MSLPDFLFRELGDRGPFPCNVVTQLLARLPTARRQAIELTLKRWHHYLRTKEPVTAVHASFLDTLGHRVIDPAKLAHDIQLHESHRPPEDRIARHREDTRMRSLRFTGTKRARPADPVPPTPPAPRPSQPPPPSSSERPRPVENRLEGLPPSLQTSPVASTASAQAVAAASGVAGYDLWEDEARGDAAPSATVDLAGSQPQPDDDYDDDEAAEEEPESDGEEDPELSPPLPRPPADRDIRDATVGSDDDY